MAEQLAGLGGALQGTVQGALTNGQGFLDSIFPPEKRADLWARFNKFATERPKFAAFLLSQIAISGVPLGLFILMTITVAIFSIVAALLVGLLGALLFIVFAVGVALCLLLPTLFFTTLMATFLFLWGLGGYYILKWFNEKRIPGIHTGFVEGIKGEFMSGDKSENQQLDALNPDGSRASGHKEDTEERGANGEVTNGTLKEKKPRQLPIEAPGAEQLDSARTTATEGLGNISNAAKSREIPKLGTMSVGLG